MYMPLAVAALFLVQVVGSEMSYTIQTGDSLTKIGARFGVSPEGLADANGLKLSTRLQIGQPLRINSRHIVPSVKGARIVVNIPQRMLFWVSSDKTIEGFPMAAGKRGWKTPVGDFTVASREVDPTWDVPVSIQAEMQREGKPVLTRVPPSPQNPLGK
jgi:L,D-transpeptidase ErfK/SrfK